MNDSDFSAPQPGKLLHSALPQMLLAAIVWVSGAKFFIEPAGSESWKTLGTWLPALWLAGVGPDGLLKSGGLLMRLFKKPEDILKMPVSRRRVLATLSGLVWIVFGIGAGVGMETLVTENRPATASAEPNKSAPPAGAAASSEKKDPEPGTIWARILLTLAYGGLTAGGGVFVFMAMRVEEKSGDGTEGAGEDTKKGGETVTDAGANAGANDVPDTARKKVAGEG